VGVLNTSLIHTRKMWRLLGSVANVHKVALTMGIPIVPISVNTVKPMMRIHTPVNVRFIDVASTNTNLVVSVV
jgi:hypothetical protein